MGRRGGVMMPRGRMPMMSVGRGGYPFPGHPADFYFNPYLDENVEFYGHGKPPYHREMGKFCRALSVVSFRFGAWSAF